MSDTNEEIKVGVTIIGGVLSVIIIGTLTLLFYNVVIWEKIGVYSSLSGWVVKDRDNCIESNE